MNDIRNKIRMHDAQELAAGYTGAFRKVEIASIALFWPLLVIWALRLWPHAGEGHWAAWLCGLLAGLLVADFVSGLVHWSADTWGSVDMPVIGKALLRPFREHHVDPKAMTQHDYIETNGASCMISLPVLTTAVLLPLQPESAWYGVFLAAVVAMGVMVFLIAMTNQIHKWSHQDNRPGIVTFLENTGLILSPRHHEIHHTAPFNTYYCITLGWLNWPLAKINFFRRMESIVTSLTGALPRADDIGVAAALAIAPATPQAAPASPPSGADVLQQVP